LRTERIVEPHGCDPNCARAAAQSLGSSASKVGWLHIPTAYSRFFLGP
jgi:hypothetical protein